MSICELQESNPLKYQEPIWILRHQSITHQILVNFTKYIKKYLGALEHFFIT